MSGLGLAPGSLGLGLVTSGLGLGLGLVTSGLGLGLGLATSGLVNIPGILHLLRINMSCKWDGKSMKNEKKNEKMKKMVEQHYCLALRLG